LKNNVRGLSRYNRECSDDGGDNNGIFNDFHRI
jgi:hypothetical protein